MDKLPPYDAQAEAQILGSAMMSPEMVVPNARRRFGTRDVFYDIRHIEIWRCLCDLHDNAKLIDLVTVAAWLDSRGTIQDAGGREYIATLGNDALAPENWPGWCDVIMDKWAERHMLRTSARIQDWLADKTTTVDRVIKDTLLEVGHIEEVRAAALDASPRVKRPQFWAEEIWALFTSSSNGQEPGTELPFGFPLRIRPGELTLCCGEKGNGKTTMLCYITLFMLARGWKGFISFMEESPSLTLKMLVSQLLGSKTLQNNEADAARARDAINWYQSRLSVYDFRGIVDYRVLLQGMEHAAEKRGANWFVIDSLMRLGIADDDYAEQGRCVMSLANFAIKHNAHVVLVNHLNKSDADTRKRQRGSQQIVDNSNNVVAIERNEKKVVKIDELYNQLKVGAIPQSEFDTELAELRKEWDAKFRLLNQRYQGSQQNGVKQLWFQSRSLQFSDSPEGVPIDYLSRWKAHPLKPDAPNAQQRN